MYSLPASRPRGVSLRRLWAAALALALLVFLVPAAAGSSEYQIVNGEPAADGAYPWMAGGLFGDELCGASVIAEEWLLTAAHCFVDGRGQSKDPATATFRVDTNDFTDESELLQAVELVPHPDYDPVNFTNDIALIRVDRPAPVTPVRVATADDAALELPPTVARVIGYGAIATGAETSDTLLQVDVDVVDFASCEEAYAPAGLSIGSADLVLCAGNPTDDPDNPGRDSCQGDSGGPLFVESEGGPVQTGVVSFGLDCGVAQPGVYTKVSAYLDWIEGTTGGLIPPGDPDPGPGGEVPDGAEAEPIRIGNDDDPITNAIAISQRTFIDSADFGVLALSGNFPDALGGSALASYLGPLLYVDAAGQLGEDTLDEFRRVLDPGATVYVLGGEAVIGPDVDAQLQAAGFTVQRLAGTGRQETAARVAEEVLATVNEGLGAPFDTAIVSFEGNWPDAVTVGQISAFWGIPILLTPTGMLGDAAAAYLTANAPTTVLVTGGTSVVSDAVVAEIEAITGPDSVERLGGDTRLETTAQITRFNADVLYPLFDEVFEVEGGEPFTTPEVVIAVNLRRDDAFAHVLAASVLAGSFGGVFAPLEGADGSVVDQVVLDSICATDLQVVAVGGPNLVPQAAVDRLQAAAAGEGCAIG